MSPTASPEIASTTGSIAPGIAPIAISSALNEPTAKPAAATISWRETRATRKPPPSMPAAEPRMYAVIAEEANPVPTPNCSFIAETPKFCSAPSAAACSAKNAKHITTDRASSTRASSAAPRFFASACAGARNSGALTPMSSSTTKASAAAASSALCQP